MSGFRDPHALRVRRYLRMRRRRESLFPAELFADPAWDMMLDLFASEIEGRELMITSVCLAAIVPPTTALRWVGKLEALGLIERFSDRDDKRRRMIRLTGTARERIAIWVEEALSD